jgi:hypothetical protein
MRHHAKFEGDLRDAALDNILNYAIAALFPFLSARNHARLAKEIERHLATHLAAKLAIVNGRVNKEVDSPVLIRLRQKFKETP